ncbi:MAG TPA: hypothetical protein VKB77_12035 [Terriglobales bacterium]|nr:hypothetical protein [Terriglobales bacterium]
MKLRDYIFFFMLLTGLLAAAVAQDENAPQSPENNNPPVNSTPSPAFGQEGPAPQQNVDNPPLSGLDLPNLDPNASSRSFLVPGIHVSEALDSNISNQLGNSTSFHGVTRALGSLALQKLWRNYNLGLQYVGGGAYYGGSNIGWTQFHSLDADQRYLWRTGQFALRDRFSYLPEGAFGYGAYGGSGALAGVGGLGGEGGLTGVGLGPGGSLLGGSAQLASLGQDPRITNTAIADIVQALSPRSSFTLAGSFGLVHFLDTTSTQIVNGVPVTFINSQAANGQAGYNYQITRSDQIGFLYGYQSFHYPTSVAGDFRTHIFHVLYGHRISGRMDLVLGGGPQLTHINNLSFGSTSTLNVSGQASLRYRFPLTSVSVTYDRYNSNGSGFYGGAKTNLFRFIATRPFGRLWSATADVGYTTNTRILPATTGTVPGQSFNYFYAGASVHRHIGREFEGFAAYQFNNLNFDSSFCANVSGCHRTSDRQVILLGLDWTPRPIRLD